MLMFHHPPAHLLKSRMVAIDCAHHTGHWPLQHQAPRAFAAQLLAVLVQEIEHGWMMRNEVEPRAPDIHREFFVK